MARKQSNPANSNKPFPAALRTLMEERNTSQKDLAEYLGKTRQAISLYCNGESAPDLESLVKIAQYFDTSTDYLLGLTNDPSRDPSAIDELGLSPQAIGKLKSCCLEGNTTGFIDGINTILTLPRLSILAKNMDTFHHYYFTVNRMYCICIIFLQFCTFFFSLSVLHNTALPFLCTITTPLDICTFLL